MVIALKNTMGEEHNPCTRVVIRQSGVTFAFIRTKWLPKAYYHH